MHLDLTDQGTAFGTIPTVVRNADLGLSHFGRLLLYSIMLRAKSRQYFAPIDMSLTHAAQDWAVSDQSMRKGKRELIDSKLITVSDMPGGRCRYRIIEGNLIARLTPIQQTGVSHEDPYPVDRGTPIQQTGVPLSDRQGTPIQQTGDPYPVDTPQQNEEVEELDKNSSRRAAGDKVPSWPLGAIKQDADVLVGSYNGAPARWFMEGGQWERANRLPGKCANPACRLRKKDIAPWAGRLSGKNTVYHRGCHPDLPQIDLDAVLDAFVLPEYDFDGTLSPTVVPGMVVAP